MNIIKQGKTNWKYIGIVIFLALITTGAIFIYQKDMIQEMTSLLRFHEIEKPEKEPPKITETKAEEERKEFIPFEDWEEKIHENIPDEVENILLEDIPTPCEGKDEANIEDYGFWYKSIDLNDDEINEFIVFPATICDELIRGVSANGPIYIFQKINEKWIKIGDMQGNNIGMEKLKSNKYRDVMTNWHLSAASGVVTRYKWRESISKYEEWYSVKIDLSN